MNIEEVKRLCPEFADWYEFALLDDMDEDDKKIKMIIETLAEARQALEWRPIESAPKDGRTILSYQPFKSGYNCIEKTHYANGWVHGPVCSDCPLSSWEPTHWMPLPTPPSQTVKEGG